MRCAASKIVHPYLYRVSVDSPEKNNGEDRLMIPDKLPKHAVLIRWGTFRLDLVGRAQIIGAIVVLGTLIGLKVLVF